MMRYLILLFSFYLITDSLKAQIEKEPLPTQDATEIQIKSSNTILGRVD